MNKNVEKNTENVNSHLMWFRRVCEKWTLHIRISSEPTETFHKNQKGQLESFDRKRFVRIILHRISFLASVLNLDWDSLQPKEGEIPFRFHSANSLQKYERDAFQSWTKPIKYADNFQTWNCFSFTNFLNHHFVFQQNSLFSLAQDHLSWHALWLRTICHQDF